MGTLKDCTIIKRQLNAKTQRSSIVDESALTDLLLARHAFKTADSFIHSTANSLSVKFNLIRKMDPV